MAKKKRWALASGVLSLCVFGCNKAVINQAVASPVANPSVVSLNSNLNNTPKEKVNTSENDSVETVSSELTLDQFIEDTIRDNKTTYKKQNVNVLKTDLLLTNQEFINNKSINLEVTSGSDKAKSVKKLAAYISNTYNVSLLKAEAIVKTAFAEAAKKDLEPTLVLSIIGIESMFNQYSKSSAGAVGLTQVMPHVHKTRIAQDRINVWSIQGNIKLGTDILKDYLKLAGGNVRKALQMYNGSARDRRYAYSNKVMGQMQAFRIAAL